jgi:hypothetical protein
MIRRTRRDKEEGKDIRLTPEQVDALTARANELLDELHDVLGDMAERLATLSAGSE